MPPALRIVLFGLGHVGTTQAACLAAAGHRVTGVELDPARRDAVARGRAPVREPGLDDLVAQGRASGRLAVAASAEPGDIAPVLAGADLAVVCVGTPAAAGGGLDLAAVAGLTQALGPLLRTRTADRPLPLAYRSTLPTGTMDGLVLPLLAEGAGEGPGPRYEAAYHPEFLRQGSAVADGRHPPRLVLGERSLGATRRLAGLYAADDPRVIETSFAAAELAKLADNGWHALKVAFANEVGRLAWAAGTDPQAVMAIVRAGEDGAGYSRPGAPYGGSCLPKDLGTLLDGARASGLELPALAGAVLSNERHLGWLLARVRAAASPPGPLLLVGLGFKPGSDDPRGSPLRALARRLAAAGYAVRAHDPDMSPSALRAACRDIGVVPAPDLARALAPEAGVRLVVRGKPVRLPKDVPCLAIDALAGPDPT